MVSRCVKLAIVVVLILVYMGIMVMDMVEDIMSNQVELMFFESASELSCDVMRRIVRFKEVDVNARDKRGRAALHLILDRVRNKKRQHDQRSKSAEKGDGSTAAAAAVADDDDSDDVDAMMECLEFVLEQRNVDPNIGYPSRSPLKVAVQRGHTEAIQALLSHPKTIPKISSHGLTCASLGHIPETVSLIASPKAAECVKAHPSYPSTTTPAAASPATDDDKTITGKTELLKQQESAVPAAASKRDKLDEDVSELVDNPFSSSVPALLKSPLSPRAAEALWKALSPNPSHSAAILNPAVFPNLFEVVRFYFFGPSASTLAVSLVGTLLGVQFVLLVQVLRKGARTRGDQRDNPQRV